jgi:hypothetical protein
VRDNGRDKEVPTPYHGIGSRNGTKEGAVHSQNRQLTGVGVLVKTT